MKDKFITDVEELVSYLELPVVVGEELTRVFSQYPLKVSLSYLQRIKKGDVGDPLLLQIMPSVKEDDSVTGFVDDALDENFCFTKSLSLMQKYEFRCLLLCTNECACNCRFCFRRHTRNKDLTTDYAQALKVLSEDSSLKEVILSGGDPLSLSNAKLADLLSKLSDIPHVEFVRIHTRYPVMVPSRIDKELVSMFNTTDSNVRYVFVLHVNHPNELDQECSTAISKLTSVGVNVLSQTVLLKGVNDSVDVLKELYIKLSKLGVVPYYLHSLDRVNGAAHFEVSKEIGMQLVRLLREQMSGYMVPRYVEEVPKLPYKNLIF